MPIPAGTCIGPYEVVGWIGAGGMGEVYRARDPRLAREVAIKLIADQFATDPGRVHRFEQEARAVGQINHPNILAVYDIGRHHGTPYIVSELLEGESVRSRLKAGPLSSGKVVDLARQTTEGLAAAHDKNLVHRDLKPDNLFITLDGRIKILDFGIAKLTVSADSAARVPNHPTETAAGMVVGTTGYMSPEQIRGETVDARSDIFSLGTVLHEMLTGRAAFIRGTGVETMAAILKEDPAEPLAPSVPAGLARIVARCLEKAREARFQTARDLAFALEFMSGASTASAAVRAPRRWPLALGTAIVGLSMFGAVDAWLRRETPPAGIGNPLEHATFTPITNWEGTEEGGEISPDGKLVAFLSDRGGEYDIWLSQIGTDHFTNLTADIPPLASSGSIVRKLGFSGDGSEIWFNPADGKPLLLLPWTGGPPRPFLEMGTNTPAWSPDGKRFVYVYKPDRDDPIYLADRTGADPTQILAPGPFKNLNPVWSPDGEWIYFVRGTEPQDGTGMDVWRLRPAGGSPEQVTEQHLAVNFLAALDTRTLLYVARDEDGAGPWLWALDVERRQSRRIPSGVDQYTSVSASRDGQHIVATVANPSTSLWRVPLLDRLVEERDALLHPLPAPTGLASAPRFGKTTLFYLSARGTRDGLWKVEDGKTSDVWRSVDGALSEPPAVSSDGRVALVVKREGKRRLSIMAADGTGVRALAPSIDIEGAAGQGAADWSPDGTRIVTGGRDARGPALFLITVQTGAIVRLRDGNWVNPVWSPDGKLIVYAGRSLIGQVDLLGMTPDGGAVDLPPLLVRPGGYRFLPDGSGLVYLPRIPSLDFWLLDFATRKSRPLTSLGNQGALRTFDITPDGKYLVFDRSRQNANIILIRRPGPPAVTDRASTARQP